MGGAEENIVGAKRSNCRQKPRCLKSSIPRVRSDFSPSGHRTKNVDRLCWKHRTWNVELWIEIHWSRKLFKNWRDNRANESDFLRKGGRLSTTRDPKVINTRYQNCYGKWSRNVATNSIDLINMMSFLNFKFDAFITNSNSGCVVIGRGLGFQERNLCEATHIIDIAISWFQNFNLIRQRGIT